MFHSLYFIISIASLNYYENGLEKHELSFMLSNFGISDNVLYAGSRNKVSRYPRDFEVCCKLSSGARFQL